MRNHTIYIVFSCTLQILTYGLCKVEKYASWILNACLNRTVFNFFVNAS